MKNPEPNKSAVRTSRIESLEDRQMLDAMTLAVDAPELAYVAAASPAESEAISLSELSNAENEITFTNAGVENVYIMDWADMDGASGYNKSDRSHVVL